MLTGVCMRAITDGIMVAVIVLGVARRRTGYDHRRTEHHRKRQQDRESPLQGSTPSFPLHSQRDSSKHEDRVPPSNGLFYLRFSFEDFERLP